MGRIIVTRCTDKISIAIPCEDNTCFCKTMDLAEAELLSRELREIIDKLKAYETIMRC